MNHKDEATQPITIIGGGIGGLMLARVLYVKGIPARVYEIDATPNARTQGGQLDIHEYNGQVALEAGNLIDEFHNIIHEGADAAKVLDTNAEVLLEEPSDDSNGRPEVLRGDLRQMLIQSLPEESIAWGKKAKEVKVIENGEYQVTFEDGSTLTTDKLVGGDGAWSKVRRVLSDVNPHYTGLTFFETYLHDVDQAHPETAKVVGQGAMYALTPGKGIVAHREANGIIHTYIQLECDESWVDSFDYSNSEAVAEALAAEFEGWAPELLALIKESDTGITPRKINSLPDDFRWEHQSNVTLIGDAAHLMAPSGEGANIAMYDAVKLAEAIEQHPDQLDEAFKVYEEDMFKRSADAFQESHEAIEMTLGKNSPKSLINVFQSKDPDAE